MEAFDRYLTYVSRYLAYVAGAVMIFVLVLITADVVGRYVFNHPIKGTYELGTVAVPLMLYLPLPLTEAGRARANIKMELFVTKLPRVSQDMMGIFAYSLGAAFLGTATWLTFKDMLVSWAMKQVIVGTVPIPVYISKTAIPLGFGLTTLAFLVCVVDRVRGLLLHVKKQTA